MSYPNPPQEGHDPFQKPSGGQGYDPQQGQQPPYFGQPQSGQPGGPPPQYGQPQYGQQPPQYAQPQFGQPQGGFGGPPAQYQQVPPGYYPVFNSQGQQVLVPLASPGKRFGTALLELVLYVVTLFIGYIIWTLFAWRDGQTPGKKITHLKYVNVETGRVADWGKSAFRDFVIRGIVIGFIGAITLYIGYLVAAFMIFDKDKNYRTGWDRWGGTVVVDVSNVTL
jgi:uncharacterized RDD family membrane protein YckC